jgi:hypothetical protein
VSILDQLGGILNQYSSGNPPQQQAPQHFQEVAEQVPQSTLSSMLTNIFHSPETGTFGQNIGQMYAQSNPQQQAGILNTLIHGAGPGLLSTLGINIPGVSGASPAAVTSERAQEISPAHVEEIANQAQQQNPGVVQQAGEFYAQHPQLVQALGVGAAIWALQRFQKS